MKKTQWVQVQTWRELKQMKTINKETDETDAMGTDSEWEGPETDEVHKQGNR